MKIKLANFSSLIAACALLACAVSSRAAILNWNPGNLGGGAGTWDLAALNWTNPVSALQSAWINSSLDSAVFSGTPGTVTLGSTITGLTNNSVTFNSSYFLTPTTKKLFMTNAATITVAAGVSATNNVIITGANTLINGPGTNLLGAANVLNTLTIDTNTTVVVTGGTALASVSSIVVNGTLVHAVSDSGSSGPILNGSGTIVGVPTLINFRMGSAGTGNFSGTLTGPLSVLFQGAGVQILSGSNDYSGNGTLLRNLGILRLASPHALSPNTWIDFSTSGATLELAATDMAATNALAAGGLTISPSAAVPAYFAAIGADRTLLLTNGTATPIHWGGTAANPPDFFNVTTLGFGSVNSDHTLIWAGDLNLGTVIRTIDTRHGTEAIAGEIRGALSDGGTGLGGVNKTGLTGTLALTGTNTYGGGTTFNGGVLALGNDSALGSGPLKFNTSSTLLRSLDASPRNLPIGLTLGADANIGTPTTGDFVFNGPIDGGVLSNVRTITISNANTTFTGVFTSDAPASFIKAGPGALVLAGDSSGVFVKALVVTNASLVLSNSSVNNVIPGCPSLTLKSGTTLDVTAMTAPGGFQLGSAQVLGGSGTILGNVSVGVGGTLAPGELGRAGTLTLSNNLVLTGGGTLNFDLTNITTIGSAVNDLVSVAGNLDLGSGDTTVVLAPLPPGGFVAGTYRLINYTGSRLGSGTLTVSAPPSRFTFTIDTSTPHQVNVLLTGAPGNLIWKGDALGNVWDTTTPNNWLLGGSPNFYFDLDNVTFNDSSTNLAVNLNQTVAPTSVTVASSKNYTLQGGGKITGGTALLKSGSGTLNVETANDFASGVTISNGVVNVGAGVASASIGAGPIFIITNASFIVNSLGDSTLGTLSGGGALVQAGANTVLSLNNNAPFTGSVSAQAGQVSIFNANGFGANPGPTTVSDNAAVFVSSVGFTTFPQPFSLRGLGYNGANGALHIGASGQTYSGPFSLPADATIGFDFSASVATITGPVMGPGSLTVTGSGTLALAGTNTYNATTVAGPGTLQIGNGSTNGTLGTNSGPITVNGILAFNRSDIITLTNQVIGSGQINQVGSGTLVLSTSNLLDGTATSTFSANISGGGTLALANDYALGAGGFNMNSSTVRSADASLRVIGNPLTLSASMTFGSPGTGDLLFTGDMNTGTAAKTLTINNGVTTFSGDLFGNASTTNTKAGPGTLILAGVNSYTKSTLVSSGVLLVNGSIPSGANKITINVGAALGGNGVIGAEVIPISGSTLFVGPDTGPTIGILTINNTLLLSGTPTIVMKLDKSVPTNDVITGIGSMLISTGTHLVLTNIAGTLAAGDSFKLFDANTFGNHFADITPATPGPNLAWNTNTLYVDGTIRISAIVKPVFNSLLFNSPNLVLSGTNGTPLAPYVVLASTNVSLPVASWTPITTNSFDSNGNFTYTNTVSAGVPHQFFMLRTQ